MTKDILKLDDVKHLVDSFYGKIREDQLLKDIFNNIIHSIINESKPAKVT